MKKIRVAENVKIIGIKNFTGKGKQIDYYLVTPRKRKYMHSANHIPLTLTKYANLRFG